MKLFWTTSIALSLTLGGWAAETTTVVTSKIDKVTVFLNGAQVERTAKQSVTAGTTFLKFTELSPNIDPSSVQVKGEGKITILSVTHEINYLTSTEKPKEITQLEEKMESLNLDLKFNQNLSSVYDEERKMILNNNRVGWEKSTFNVEDLSDLADFYRDRLSDIMLKVLELQTKEKVLREDINKINRQLNVARGNWKKATSEVIVEISANQAATASMRISYLVNQAGWVPSYDVRAKNITQPVALKYNGRVFQSTGVEWKDVQLVLSTGNPKLNNQKPDLNPWRLRYLEQLGYYRGGKADRKKSKATAYGYDALNPETVDNGDDEMSKMEAGNVSLAATPGVAVVDNQVNVNFAIKVNYTIPADGQRHLVNVDDIEIPATYRYYSAPKLDKTAFLLAKVTGWSSFNLIPGEANVYFQGTYIGKSFIDSRETSDTLDLSMGRDPSIVVTREKSQQLCKNNTIGSNQVHTIAWDITVRNTKSTAIEMDLEDQVPLSTDRSISVTLDESSSAAYNEKTGKLSWQLNLAPGETKTIRLTYTVKFPKGKSINL